MMQVASLQIWNVALAARGRGDRYIQGPRLLLRYPRNVTQLL